MLADNFKRLYVCIEKYEGRSHQNYLEDYSNRGSCEKNGKTYQILRFARIFCDGGSGGGGFFSEGNKPFVFELGIRESDGRFLVDRDEYLSLLADESPWSTVGDKDYLPYEETNDGELVLYDFNMRQGDKFRSVEGHDDIVVDEVKQFTTRDGSRRLLCLSNGYQILEGVGCLNSPGTFLFYLNHKEMVSPYSPYVEYEFALMSCTRYEEGEGMLLDVYNYEDYKDNKDLNAISAIESVPQTSGGTLFDLQGRRLTAEPQRGLYIRDGRKYVVKE
jgi:hypothetical protein